jgi:hypothetical protein
MFKSGNYYYLFYSSGVCCGYDTSRPASGEEYKIKVCRSTSPTGGFVSVSSSPVVYCHKVLTGINPSRLTRTASPAPTAGVRWSWSRTTRCMGQEDKACSTILTLDRSFITTMSIQQLGMQMVKSGSDGTNWTSQADGQLPNK